MKLRVNIGTNWRTGVLHFLKYISEERRWRRTWMCFGDQFECIGVIDGYNIQDNDNARSVQ
jgi:hypothetical protein